VITVTVTFEEQTTSLWTASFIVMRKTYKIFGLQFWENVQRANF
jgi:hypothetical protein